MRTFLRIIPATLALAVGLGQFALAAPNPKTAPKKKQINVHLVKAVQFSRAHKWDQAVEEYRAAIKAEPGSVLAYTNLGLTYMQMHQAKNAEIAFRQVLVKEPNNEQVLQQLTSALLLQGKANDALPCARRLMSIKPKSTRYVGLFGSIYITLKDYQAAADAFRSLIHMNPKDEQAYLSLAYCYQSMTPPKYVDVLETLESLLKINPKNVQARMTAAVAAEKSKDKATAIRHYEAASSGPAAVQALLNLARLYREMQQPEKSVNALLRIVKIDKNNFDANFNLGAYEYGKANWKKAEAYWKAARKAQPTEPTINLNYSMVLARQNRFKEALSAAEVAYKGQPKNPSILEGYGYILECNSQQEKALDVYEQWQKLNPKSAVPNEKMAVVYSALARKAQLDKKDAAKEKEYNLKACGQYAAATLKDPDNADLIGQYADALNAAQAYDKAAPRYEAALKLKPDSEVLVMKYSGFLKEQKKADEALSLLEKTAGKYPKNETLQLILAQEYNDQKLKDKAAEVYQKVVALNPKNSLALQSLTAIYTEQKKFADAVSTSEKLVKLDPKNTYYAMALAEALDKNGDSTAALEKYQDLAKSDVVGLHIVALQRIAAIQEKMNKPDEAIATYKQILNEKPGNIEALSSLSKVCDANKKTDDFLAYLKSIVESNKPNTPYQFIMDAYTKAGKINDAIAIFEGIYAKSPNNAETASILASAYVANKQKDKAIPVYEKIISTFAEDQVANKELGLIYRGLGKSSEAFKCLSISRKQGTLNTDELLDYGRLCEELGKTTDAKNAYTEYLKSNPANQEVKKKIGELESATPPASEEPAKTPVVAPAATETTK